MGKNSSKKRKNRGFASGNDGVYNGVAETLSQLKRRRLSVDGSAISRSSPDVTAPGDGNDRSADSGGEWETIARKKQREQSTYPEIIFHTKQQIPIRIKDLQNLALYVLTDGVSPSWLAFKNARQTRKAVVLMVPGLETEMLDGSEQLHVPESDGHSHVANGNCDGRANGTTSISISDNRRNFQGDQQQSNFQAWKNGSTLKEPSFDSGSPIPLDSAKLPPFFAPLASIFTHVWPVKSPGDTKYSKVHSPLQAMLISPILAPPENKAIKGPKPPAEEKFFSPIRTPIPAFIHSAEELQKADYPVHPATFTSPADAQLELERREKTGQSASSGWVNTNVTTSTPILPDPPPSPTDLTCGLHVCALDCEMVLTSDNLYSLARISLLSHTGTVLLDKYVKPDLPITNYYTQYSGITPNILENVTTTLSDIQAELLDLLTPSTILLGHSLESDLNALKLTHPFVIDTALIYPHPRGMPLRSSLKYLATRYLRRDIQGSASGHDSVEDARAVLDLVKLKAEKGPKWGTSEASGESIFRRLSRAKGKDGALRTSAMVDYGTPERGYGKEADIKIGCSNDDEVVAGVIRAVNGDPDGKDIRAGGVDFVWGRLRALEFGRGWSKDTKATGDETPVDVSATDQETPTDNSNSSTKDYLPALMQTLIHISALYASLPPCTLLVIYSGTGDPRPLVALQQQQATYRKEFKVKRWDDLSVKWTDDEEQALKAAAEKARSGLGLVCVTKF